MKNLFRENRNIFFKAPPEGGSSSKNEQYKERREKALSGQGEKRADSVIDLQESLENPHLPSSQNENKEKYEEGREIIGAVKDFFQKRGIKGKVIEFSQSSFNPIDGHSLDITIGDPLDSGMERYTFQIEYDERGKNIVIRATYGRPRAVLGNFTVVGKSKFQMYLYAKRILNKAVKEESKKRKNTSLKRKKRGAGMIE